MIKGCLLQLFVWTQRDLDVAIYGPIVAKLVLVHYKKLGRISTILTKTGYDFDTGGKRSQTQVINVISLEVEWMMLLHKKCGRGTLHVQDPNTSV